jgi:hypothetical protein
MATDLEGTIRLAAAKLARFVEDAAAMMVKTQFVELGEDLTTEHAKPIARTVFSADGDCQTIIPLRRSDTGELAVDRDLLELHDRNVGTTVEYRARLFNALLEAIQSRRR